MRCSQYPLFIDEGPAAVKLVIVHDQGHLPRPFVGSLFVKCQSDYLCTTAVYIQYILPTVVSPFMILELGDEFFFPQATIVRTEKKGNLNSCL